MTVTIADIEAARRAIAGRVVCTPMLPAPKLSALTGASVQVKYENMQVTNSFKERGALNKLVALTPAERARGVIAMSAGNHAQAVKEISAKILQRYLTKAGLEDPRVGPVFAAAGEVTIRLTPQSWRSWELKSDDDQFFGGLLGQRPEQWFLPVD